LLQVGGNDNTTTFSGNIDGLGTFAKVGAGTLTLTGDNSYARDTLVSGGTLIVDSDSLPEPVLGSVRVNNARLLFFQASDGTYSGAIAGNGTVDVSGAGTLTLAGNNSHQGGTGIADGGVLEIASDINLGHPNGPLRFNNGTLRTTGTMTSARDVVIFTEGSEFQTVSGTHTITRTITGDSSLT